MQDFWPHGPTDFRVQIIIWPLASLQVCNSPRIFPVQNCPLWGIQKKVQFSNKRGKMHGTLAKEKSEPDWRNGAERWWWENPNTVFLVWMPWWERNVRSKTQSAQVCPRLSLPLAGPGDPTKFAKGVTYMPALSPFTPFSPPSTLPSINSFWNKNNFLDRFV